MIIEVKGVQFTNKGAELMLAAVKQTLAQHLPNAKIAIAPSNNASAKQIQAQGYLVRRHIRKRLFDLNSLSSLIPAVTTLADAPIKVPFPPRQAPKARAHIRGPKSKLSESDI